MSAATGESAPKKPFYKNWIFWWCLVVLLMVVAAIDEKKKDGKSDKSTASPAAKEYAVKHANISDARRFTEEHLKSRYGRVIEMSSVNNGSYFGFPTGSSVYTFAGTVLRNNYMGEHPTLNVVIAVQFDGDDWAVAKIHVD